jgi:hypothetical protein
MSEANSEVAIDKNYLTAENQENDIPSHNSNPMSFITSDTFDESDSELVNELSTCDDDSKEYKSKFDNGQNFPRQDELYEAINDMKTKIYMDFFQSGSAEKVHDTNILNKYLSLIGSIWRLVTSSNLNPDVIINSQNDNVKSTIKTFLQILNEHLHIPENTAVDNEMRTLFLKLHLHCYPYCMNHNCLSNDV